MKNNLSGGQAKSALNNGVAGVTTGELDHPPDGPGKALTSQEGDGLVRHTVAARRVAGWAAPIAEGPQRGIAKSAAQSFWKGFRQGVGLGSMFGGALLAVFSIPIAYSAPISHSRARDVVLILLVSAILVWIGAKVVEQERKSL